ncbi:MAG: hypothetical protein H6587_07520 [Flavobacteriales bacterium]|nr:hypothetical protein [Flavobacteriales bacterium]MCB9364400.1 hypothetical protein [Flavobacteriales bacterium]
MKCVTLYYRKFFTRVTGIIGTSYASLNSHQRGDNKDAEELAHLSELPDTEVHDHSSHVTQNYTWADPKKQKRIHSLLGSNADPTKVIAFATARLLNAETTEELSEALHFFGDVFAHQRLKEDGYYGDKGKVESFSGRMFEWITGGTAEHAHGVEPDGSGTGLRPDLIYERTSLFKSYVKNLSSTLKEKYQLNGEVDWAIINNMTEYAKANKVSLIGIINYEVAKFQDKDEFYIQNSRGLASYDIYKYSRNTEKYLMDKGVEYEKELIFNTEGDVPVLESIKFTIKETE